MASLYTKFLDFIGIEESDEQDDERANDGYYRDEAPERTAGAFGRRARELRQHRRNERVQNASGANLPISGGMKMIVYHPVSYEGYAEHHRQPEKQKTRHRQHGRTRAGHRPAYSRFPLRRGVCAQRHDVQNSRGIFVVAPNNYDVVGNGEDDYGDLV